MKILDRYIMLSVAGAFLFSIAMFMALLMAMDLLSQLIKLIAEQGVPVAMALRIFAYRIPSMLVYAFPMSMLLSILLVFNQMSSESEMVAIRAGGISFIRIVMPTLVIALIVTGITFWISNDFSPYANKQAGRLTQLALETSKTKHPINYDHLEKNVRAYAVMCSDLDVEKMEMRQVTLISFTDGAPFMLIKANKAIWNPQQGRWRFYDAYPHYVGQDGPSDGHTSPAIRAIPSSQDSQLEIEAQVLRLKENPLDLATAKKNPDDFTAKEMQAYVSHMALIGKDDQEIGYWQMALSRRYAVPFYCLVFALIAAPLGLRHHRTSSAMGLGISLLVIFAFYFTTVYLSTFGESGRMPTTLAAWIPNILGAIAGTVLIVRANR